MMLPRAFSLIELLVAVGIFVAISSVVLANHARFNSSVLLGALAYDIALSLREAQVFGLSVRQFGSDFQVGYGIRFSDDDSYFFFADTNASRAYEESDSVVRVYTLGRSHRITAFCGITAAGIEHCSNGAVPIDHLDIVFFRPDPDAVMSSGEPGFYSHARIAVSSPSGESRTVEVASTGQVSVDQL